MRAVAAAALAAAGLALGARPARAKDAESDLVAALASAAANPPLRSAPSPVPTLEYGGDKVAFDHAGKRLAASGGLGVLIWDRATWSVNAQVEVPGSIETLRFSPDDRFLYVAGGGGRAAVLARFDAATGRLDREYEGQAAALSGTVLSADGRSLASLCLHDHRLLVHDTETGMVVREGRASGIRLTPAPGGAAFLRRRFADEPGDGWAVESFRDGKDSLLELAGPIASSASILTCDDPDLVVVVNREVDPPVFQAAGSLTVFRREGGAWRVVRNAAIESATMCQRAVLSPDGALVAAAGDGNIVRVWSVAELAPLGQIQFPPDRAAKCGIRGLSFSKDDALLAVGWGSALPGLMRIDRAAKPALSRLEPWPGHAGRIEWAGFAKDGSAFRTLATDLTVCVWDGNSLSLRRRFSLPEGTAPLLQRSADDPFLCLPSEWSLEKWPGGCPLKAVDCDDGHVVYETRLPADYHADSALVVPGGDLLLIGEKRDRIGRFRPNPASLLASMPTGKELSSGWPADVWLDGGTLLVADCYVQRHDTPAWYRTDVTTGSTVRMTAPEGASLRADQFGFVPGGKYAFTAGPELRLYDLSTAAQVLRRSLGWGEPKGVVFSGDGRRYATLHEERETRRPGERGSMPARVRAAIPKGTRGVVTVEDTLSGVLLFAAPYPDYLSRLVLDADGGRLALVGGDGSVSIWRLPSPR